MRQRFVRRMRALGLAVAYVVGITGVLGALLPSGTALAAHGVVTGVTWSVSTNAPGASATWTVSFVATDSLPPSAMIELVGPDGTAFPSAAGLFDLKVAGQSSGYAGSTIMSGGGTNSVVVQFIGAPAVLPGTAVTVIAQETTNPPIGAYTSHDFGVSTVPDPTVANPASGITFAGADGSGGMTVAPGVVLAGSSGNNLTFTYTAGQGGVAGGSLEIQVPGGWTLPSATPGYGYTTASGGTGTNRVQVSGQTIDVTGVDLASSGKLTVEYQNVTAPTPASTPEPVAFPALEASSSTGTLTPLAAPVALTLNGPLAPVSGYLTSGSVGQPYAATLQPGGGLPPYTWKLARGSLPPGLTLTVAGEVYGTPTTPGPSSFSVNVTDGSTPPQTVLFTLSLNVGPAFQPWGPVAVPPAGVAGMSFFDDLHGLSVSGSGHAALTADGGVTWSPGGSLPVSTGHADVQALACASTSDCWASGGDGHPNGDGEIWRTTDGGAHWTNRFTNSGSPNAGTGLTCVAALRGSNEAWAAAGNGTVYSNTYGPWTDIATLPGLAAKCTALTFASADDGWLAQNDGTVLATTNGGVTWTAQALPPAVSSAVFYGLDFMNASDGWAVGSGGTVIGTTDGGATWTVLTEGAMPIDLYGVAFANAHDGWVSGRDPGRNASAIWATTDGGQSWTRQGTASGEDFGLLSFPDAGHGWAAGSSVVLAYGGTPVVTPAALPPAQVGLAYNPSNTPQLTAAGGMFPYTWSLAPGSALPPGLRLALSGAVTGTPTAAGDYAFNAQVTDGAAKTATGLFTLNVVPAALTVEPFPLTGAVVGDLYAASLQAVSGSGTYTWSLAAGSGPLPAGLTLNSVTGAVYGIPAAADPLGAYPFTVSVTDTAHSTATADLTLQLGPSVQPWTHEAVPSGATDEFHALAAPDDLHVLAATDEGSVVGTVYGGPPWSVVGTIGGGSIDLHSLVCTSAEDCWASGGNGFPSGTGAIWTSSDGGGTWTTQFTNKCSPGCQAGLVDLAFINASDGWAVSGGGAVLATTDGGASWRQVGSVSVPPGTFSGPTDRLLFTSPSDGWIVGAEGTIEASTDGGHTWTPRIDPDPNANGLRRIVFLNASDGWAVGDGGTVLGTTDGGATWSLLTTGVIPLNLRDIACVDSLHCWVSGGNGLVAGAVWATSDGGHAWTQQIAVGAGLPQVAFPDASHGWAVGDNGTILAYQVPAVTILTPSSGPAAGGTPVSITGSDFTVSSAVYFGNTQATVTDVVYHSSTSLTVISPPGIGTVDVTVGTGAGISPTGPSDQFTYLGPPSVTTSSLPAGTVGAPYPGATLQAAGGTQPYTWSLAAGSGQLPAGLHLNTATGAVYGTPTAPGTASFTVQVTDSSTPQQTATAPLSLTVNPAPPTLAVTTTSLADGTVGTGYTGTTLQATGGTPPYTWSLAAGSGPLPAGLHLNTATGAVYGTPTAPGTASFTVQVTDSSAPQQSATAALSLTVNPAPVISTGGSGTVSRAPTVSGVGPATGPAAGGTAITITGSNFYAPATVRFGPTAATGVTVVSPTEIQATAPAGTGTVDVIVTTPYGTSLTGSGDRYTYQVAVSQVVPTAPKFSDVPPTYWAYTAIEALAGSGIVAGYPDGTFRPAAAVTRAEFVKMLVLALGDKPGSTGQTPFRDVPAAAWYAPYVQTAYQAGIVKGTSPTTFDPQGTLTREQMAVLVARALKLTQTAPLHFTDDAQIDAWALQGVEEAVAGAYVVGFPNGSFQPLADATRAQAASVLALVVKRSAG